MSGRQLLQRRDLGPGKDVGPIGGRRMLAAEAEAFDEIVDVGQVIVDVAATEHRESAASDAPKQLQQSPIARTVDARGPDDRSPRRRGGVPLARAISSPSSFVT